MEEEIYAENSTLYAETKDVAQLKQDSKGRVIFRTGKKNSYHYMCKECGEVRYIRPPDIARGRGILCSRLCFYSSRNPYLTKNPEATQSNLCMPIDLTPSPVLAYILGVIVGDGSVNVHNVKKPKYKGQRRNLIRLNVIHYEFAKSFFDALREIGLNPCIFIMDGATPNHHPQWHVGAHSFTFALFYQDLRQDLEMMKEFIEKCPNGNEHFLRGFYESEGSYYIQVRRAKGRREWNGKHLTMSNTDTALIALVIGFLKDLGFHPRLHAKAEKRPNRKPHYEISILTKEQAAFIQLIKPCIKNKRGKGLKKETLCLPLV